MAQFNRRKTSGVWSNRVEDQRTQISSLMTVICGQMGGVTWAGRALEEISIIFLRVHALRLIVVDAKVLRRIKPWSFC